MRTRTIDGISINAGDQIMFHRPSYVGQINQDTRIAEMRRIHSVNTWSMRIDDDQPYKVIDPMQAYRRQVIAKVLNVEWTGRTIYGNGIGYVTMVLMDGRTMRLRIRDNSTIVYAVENNEFKTAWHHWELTKANRLSGRVREY